MDFALFVCHSTYLNPPPLPTPPTSPLSYASTSRSLMQPFTSPPDLVELTPKGPALLDGTGSFQLVVREGFVPPGTHVRVQVEVLSSSGEKVRVVVSRLWLLLRLRLRRLRLSSLLCCTSCPFDNVTL